MKKVKIKNLADKHWQTTIEQRAYLMLSSLSSSIGRVTIRFNEISSDGVMPRRFRCSASSPDLAAGNYEVSVEHPNGSEAIEGALNRFRRIVSHSRVIGRMSTRRKGSTRQTT